jgi:Ca2+-binding EF-hand superfamily protein
LTFSSSLFRNDDSSVTLETLQPGGSDLVDELEVIRMINSVDADHNGQLNFDEFVMLFKNTLIEE